MNNNLILNPDGTVRLCARKTCCPTMKSMNDGTVKITDDNGNSIIIDRSQARLINDGLNLLDGDSTELLCE